MPSVLRIIDANANRSREALRVMEEAARFILNDADLAGAIKLLRHDLDQTLAKIAGLTAWRDTPGDVGTSLTTAREAKRDSVGEVVIAAGKRLSEALRTIEEYSKVLGTSANDLPVAIEQLRYRGYELERRLNQAMGANHIKQWRLCVLISQDICGRNDWLMVAAAAIDGGADCIQLREKPLDDGELLRRVSDLVKLARPRQVTVIVNDRPDIALLAGADGVHLGQDDLPCAQVRRIFGRQLLIGVSTANLDQAQRAAGDGADYCGVGPMFPSTTKHKDIIAGPEYLQAYLAWGKRPHLAIGGIDHKNLASLVKLGIAGIAVSSCVCGSPDPAATCRQLREELGD